MYGFRAAQELIWGDDKSRAQMFYERRFIDYAVNFFDYKQNIPVNCCIVYNAVLVVKNLFYCLKFLKEAVTNDINYIPGLANKVERLHSSDETDAVVLRGVNLLRGYLGKK